MAREGKEMGEEGILTTFRVHSPTVLETFWPLLSC